MGGATPDPRVRARAPALDLQRGSAAQPDSGFRPGLRRATAGNVLGAAVGQELGQTPAELIRRGMSIAPTLEIRPGYAFNVMVTQDLVFPAPYDDTLHP